MNKAKVVDALNGVKTNDKFDAKNVAEYLWTWADLNSMSAARFDIANELYNMDKTSKTSEEHAEFCRKNYKKILDKYYGEVKKEVDKLLSEGYKKTDNYFKNLK